MKLRIFSICLCLVFCLSFLNTSASNAKFTDITVDYDRATGTVSISGKAPFAENMSEAVRLVVLKPETDVKKLTSGEETFLTCGVHVDEVMLDEDAFSFENFVIPTSYAPGKYIVRIAKEDVAYDGAIPVGTVEQATALLNNASHEEIQSYIEMYNDVYGLDTDDKSIYGHFDSKGTKYVLSKLADKTYSGLDEFKDKFDMYTDIYKVKTGPWGTLEDIIISDATLLGLELNKYNLLSESEQDKVFKELVGNLYESDTEFKEAFDNAVKQAKKSTETSGGSTGGSGSGGSGSGNTVSWSGNPSASETAKPAAPFGDLTAHLWAEDSIIKLYNKGIINGKAEGVFAPEDCLTRAEAVKLLVLAFGGVDSNAECDFGDVDRASWMYPYIATAFEKGIIKGYENGNAGADDNITREDFCVMILRAANNEGVILATPSNEIVFSDSEDISLYAKEAVKTLQMAGVVNGMGENSFLPRAYTTRAQAAKIVSGLID